MTNGTITGVGEYQSAFGDVLRVCIKSPLFALNFYAINNRGALLMAFSKEKTVL